MNRSSQRVIASLIVCSLVGCSPRGDAPPAAPVAKASKAPKGPRLEGEIHVARQRKRILPFVLHQPSLDLRVQCLNRRDEMAKKGEATPLCFSETERSVETAMNRLRIEHREGMPITESLQSLRLADEGAHFVVDDGGTIYQLLDLALIARREGTYPAAELRVVSGNAEADAKLTAALRGLYPKLTVERIAVAPSGSGSKTPAPAPTP